MAGSGYPLINPFNPYRDAMSKIMEEMRRNRAFSGSERPPVEETPMMTPDMMGSGPGSEFAPPNPDLIPPPSEPMIPNYSTKTDSLEAYRQALAGQPVRSQYSPNKKDRLLASIAGGALTYGTGNPLSGYSMVKDILESPYSNAVEDWKLKTTGLKNAADIESDANTRSFNEYYRQASLKDLSDNRRRIDEDRDESRKISQQRADDNTRRTDIAAALAGGNNLFQDVNGNVWRVPKTGGEAVLDPKLKSLSFEDRLMLENAGRMVLQDDRQFFASQEAERAREATRIAKEKEANDKLAAGNQTTVTNVEPTAKEQIEQIRLGVARLVQQNPEYEGNVEIGETGLPTFRPSSLPYQIRRKGAKERDEAFKQKFDAIVNGDKDPRQTTREVTRGAGGTTPAQAPPKQTEPDPMPLSVKDPVPPLNRRIPNKTQKWFTLPNGSPELRMWDGVGWAVVIPGVASK